jgi:SH3 domain protein
MTKRITQLISFVFIALIFSTTSQAEPKRYITDELTVPMRTGTTNSHKILKFLKSGTAVLIKEVTEDGNHAWIMLADDNNKLGWVETKHLLDKPVARERIISINKKITSIRSKNKTLQTDLANLNNKYKELEKENEELEDRKQDLMATLTRLRESAAKPIETAEENIRLLDTIAEQKQSNEELQRKVAILSDENIKEWFLIGGGVAIGSLILGLLLTRISWRKKDGWNGGL